MDKTAIIGGMQTGAERENASRVEKCARQIGPSEAVERCLARYAKTNTRRAYSYQLCRYFGWLRSVKGASMGPDELILDNLRCVFETGPIDVQTKRKHTS